MLHLSDFFWCLFFDLCKYPTGFWNGVSPRPLQQRCWLGWTIKCSGMVRRVHCAAATFKHFRVWFLERILVKLSWAGGKSCPIVSGIFSKLDEHLEILLKWRGVASGCLFQRVVSQSYFCEIISWAVWKNDHLNSVPIIFWGSHICSLCLYLTSFSIFSFDQTYSQNHYRLPSHKNPRRCPTPVGFWHHPAEVLEWQLDANLPSRCQTTHSTKEVQRKSLYEQLVFFFKIILTARKPTRG